MQFDQATLDDQITNRRQMIRQFELMWDEAQTNIGNVQASIEEDPLTAAEAQAATEAIARLQRQQRQHERNKMRVELEITELEERREKANRGQPLAVDLGSKRGSGGKVNGKVREVPAVSG